MASILNQLGYVSIVVCYLTSINVITGLLFYLDKRRAIGGAWRVPENTLLSAALAGGSPAAKYAQRRFRHKTRKRPFARILNFIIVLQIGALVILAIPETRMLVLNELPSIDSFGAEASKCPRHVLVC